jgi:RNA polymerase sigma-70 factor (ECF subfamily)
VLPTFEFDKEKAKFRTWLGRLVRNAVIDFVRSEKKHHEDRSSGEFLEEHEDPQATNDLDDIIQKEWENNMVRLAFEAIRPKFSERAIKALEMSLQGASIEEISEKIGIKENSAYKLRNRAKKHLILEVQRLREELEQT